MTLQGGLWCNHFDLGMIQIKNQTYVQYLNPLWRRHSDVTVS